MTEKSCATCRFSNKGQNEMPCVECSKRYQNNYTPMTNADRIRQMTDEELVGIIACPYRDCIMEEDHPCIDCMRRRLQEVEEVE